MIDQSVADVMTDSVQTVSGEVTATAAAALFTEHGIGSAVVVSETGELRGIVTESDVMRQVAIGVDVTAVSVESFMTTPVVTIEPTASIETAARLMKAHSIRRLPVVDDGDLVGFLTTTNLAHYIPRLREAVLRGRREQTGA